MDKKTVYALMDRIFERMGNDALNENLPDDIREQRETHNNAVLNGIFKKYRAYYYEYLGVEPFIPGDSD